jgi:hypothetical protein
LLYLHHQAEHERIGVSVDVVIEICFYSQAVFQGFSIVAITLLIRRRFEVHCDFWHTVFLAKLQRFVKVAEGFFIYLVAE